MAYHIKQEYQKFVVIILSHPYWGNNNGVISKQEIAVGKKKLKKIGNSSLLVSEEIDKLDNTIQKHESLELE